MQITLCTIGFAGKTAEEFFLLLKDAGVRKVIDIRENRVGQLSGFAKWPDLEFFLQRIAGIAYVHEPLLAPIPQIRKAYKATRDWAQYEAAFLELMRRRSIPEAVNPADFEGVTALLCSEPGPGHHPRAVWVPPDPWQARSPCACAQGAALDLWRRGSQDSAEM